MRERKQSGRGGRRRSGGGEGPDLFAQQLAKVVEQAFAPSEGASAAAGAEGLPEVAGGAAGGMGGDLAAEGRSEAPTEEGLGGTPAARAAPERTADAADAGKVRQGGGAGWAAEEPLTARMLNEFVYCPRLFYYEHVQGVFVESADTVRGSTIHKTVDQGAGGLAAGAESQAAAGGPERVAGGEASAGDAESSGGAAGAPAEAGSGAGREAGLKPEAAAKPEGKRGGRRAKGEGQPAAEGSAQAEDIHSHSVMLGSDRLGVVAKMDLVEATLDGAGAVERVCPVDYKAGKPREGEDGRSLWDADRMQLGVQCLVLRDNGYACEEGIIYYRGTRQRVALAVTPELEAWVIEQIAAARAAAAGPIPAPLVDSPKCTRCSLAPVCLPDETLVLGRLGSLELESERRGQPEEGEGALGVDRREAVARLDAEGGGEGADGPEAPRRLMAPRDERRALYLNTPGVRIGCKDGGVLVVKEKDRVVDEKRLSDVSQVALFGNIQISTQAVQRLCEADIPVTYFNMGGRFYGLTRGHALKNVQVRIAQFRVAAEPAGCLRLARQFVRGKINNQRVLFMRNHESPPERVKARMGEARGDALAARSLEALLGIEGAAAAEYFAEFGGLLRGPDEAGAPAHPGGKGEAPWARFDFHGRNRRPPTDPVNALLSFAYSLLAKECTIAAHAVGLDPYVGFYHQPRAGRPALALDVMEEFRPLIAESAVITAVNNRFVAPKDFVTAGRAVNLNQAGRRQFFICFEQRMTALVTHPIFEYKVSYRRALELQFRILARVLTGEIPEYLPFLTR